MVGGGSLKPLQAPPPSPSSSTGPAVQSSIYIYFYTVNSFILLPFIHNSQLLWSGIPTMI